MSVIAESDYYNYYYLSTKFVTVVPLPTSTGRLGPLQQKRLMALVHDHLASDLSLTRMADEVGLSAHHFARVFKATFGTTPHRYVQHQRLEAADAALQRD